MTVFGALLIGAGIFVAVATLVPFPERANRQLSAEDAAANARRLQVNRPARDRILVPLGAAVERQLRRLTTDGIIAATERKLLLGAMNKTWTVERVLAAKLVLAPLGLLAGFTVLASVGGMKQVMMTVLLVAVGFFGPDAIINRRASARQTAIGRELPDIIDQLTVSVEAGLGFEQALVRTAQSAPGELAGELRRVVRDIQVGMSRARAMNALLERTDVEDLGKFVRAVRLAERQGQPLANTLTIQSDEARMKRQFAAEEKAMQIPVKLTFPLVLFILPALFLVVLGPAAMSLAGGF